MSNRLSEIAKNRKSLEVILKDITSESETASREAGLRLANDAKNAGLSIRQYLTLAVDRTKLGEEFRHNGTPLDGYNAAKIMLNLPVKNQFEDGVVLQAASETFQTFAGARALFPEVMDDMVRYSYRQDQIADNPDAIHTQRRTVQAPQMISTVVNDAEKDYQKFAPVAEGARVPVHSIRASETSVKFYKHGMGYQVTYEFMRRAQLDLLVPYVIRAQRERKRSEARALVQMLINGDGVHSASGEVDQSSYNTAVGTNATNGKISWQHLLHWLVARAKAGAPVDTVIGNWDAYIQWLMLFAVPAANSAVDQKTASERLSTAGISLAGQISALQGTVNFALASDAPANKLIGITRGETIETLEESGSTITESERLIQNQMETYISTVNSGPRLIFPDTRSVFDFGN